jgi:DNA polymerase-3 subunit alpha
VGGVVTAAQHFVARNGKGWGSLTLEDYNDTHEFRLYGEEYLKFKHFFNPNEFLFIRVSVREGWVNRDTQQQGEPRIQFQQVMLLQDVLSQLAKKLTLNIRQEDITPELTQKLKGLIDAHPGDKLVQVVVFDQEEEVKLHLSSRRLKVDVQPQLLDALAESGVVPHLK